MIRISRIAQVPVRWIVDSTAAKVASKKCFAPAIKLRAIWGR
jgi:hypothetical protein